jgi:phage replication O-like protein O
MAKAQIENGFAKIANELLDTMAGAALSGNEFRVLMAVIRFSYGWNQKNTGMRASVKNLSAITGMVERAIYYALQGLLKKALVLKGKSLHRGNVYQINTDIDTWKVDLPKTSIEFLPVYSDEPAESIQVEPAESIQVEPAESIQVEPAESIQVEPAESIQVQPACSSRLMRPPEAPKNNIKDNIKDSIKNSGKNNPPANYQKALEALGLPATAILSPEDHLALNALLETGCNFDDIRSARLKRKKNRLAWIQDTVCEERDRRQAGINDLKALQAELDKLYGGN